MLSSITSPRISPRISPIFKVLLPKYPPSKLKETEQCQYQKAMNAMISEYITKLPITPVTE
jgi:hypothetical protein